MKLRVLIVMVLLAIVLAPGGVAAAQLEDLIEEIRSAPPVSTADISIDKNKRIIDPVAYTPSAIEVHQAGYLNTSGTASQPLVFTFSIYTFDRNADADSSIEGICEDAFNHLDKLTGEAAWLGKPTTENRSCAIAPNGPTSLMAVTLVDNAVFTFYIVGTSGDALDWLNVMLDALNRLDQVRLGDKSWIPEGNWAIQTGPYDITNTARTPIKDRPED